MRQSPAACILLPDTVRIAFSVQVFLLEKVHFPVFHKAFEYCPSDEKLENELSPREKLVLKMRYGLYQGEEYTQREIAAQLGISRSYVSRIEKSAIGKLRQYF